MNYVIFTVLSFMWGTNFYLMKTAGLEFSPVAVAAWRVAGGAAFLGTIVLFRRLPWPLKRRDTVPMLFVAIAGYTWPFYIQNEVIAKCGHGFMAMMVAFVPLSTMLVSIPMLRVHPTRRQLFGVLGGLVCLGLILLDGLSVRNITLTSFAFAISVPVLYSICNTFIRRRFVGVAPMPLALTALLISTAILLPLALALPGQEASAGGPAATQPDQEATSTATSTTIADKFPTALVACIVLGVIGTGFGAFAFTKILQERGPLFAGMVTYLIPTIGLGWSWIDGERITPLQVVALAGVLLTVALVQFPAGIEAVEPTRLATEAD